MDRAKQTSCFALKLRVVQFGNAIVSHLVQSNWYSATVYIVQVRGPGIISVLIEYRYLGVLEYTQYWNLLKFAPFATLTKFLALQGITIGTHDARRTPMLPSWTMHGLAFCDAFAKILTMPYRVHVYVHVYTRTHS